MEIGADLGTSYNIAPRQSVAVVLDKGKRMLLSMQWGLIPHWAKEEKIANKLINARAESIAEKPSFRDSFRRRRCLIVADGFYEWRTEGGAKKPFFIGMKDGKPFGMAGLYDYWVTPEGETISTCTIITIRANELLRPIHERMPVIIAEVDYDLWLNPAVNDVRTLKELLKPYDARAMKAILVSSAVDVPNA